LGSEREAFTASGVSRMHTEATISASPGAGQEKRWVALTSVGAALLLTGTKLVVGLATGSLGLLAEAAHSGLDLVAAVITYLAVRLSDRPADAEHLYGHGKVENLSALIETALLLATCAWIISEGIERLAVKTVHVQATVWAFAVVCLSIVVDITRSRALMRVAKKHQSQALEADALHFSTDIWSSAVVLLGLILVKIGELTGTGPTFQRADAVAALAVALLVVWVSLRLGRRTVDALLDRAPAGTRAIVEAAVRQVSGVIDCPQLRLRPSGNRMFIDLEINVQRGSSLESSHDIGALVEQRIRAVLPNCDVVVHVNPVRRADETLRDRIRAIAANREQTVHNILISGEGERLYVELHVEEDPQLSLRAAHDKVEELESAIRRDLPEVRHITSHIEPLREAQERLRDITAQSAELIAHVRRVAAATPGITECHDVTVRQGERGIFLALHCKLADALSVQDVHHISSRLEDRLRGVIPRLVRVTTHPEPAET
jgi:cation diffusion facilitator family transporter